MLQVSLGKYHINALITCLANDRKLRILTLSGRPLLHYTQ
jgi:hypothetical protein